MYAESGFRVSVATSIMTLSLAVFDGVRVEFVALSRETALPPFVAGCPMSESLISAAALSIFPYHVTTFAMIFLLTAQLHIVTKAASFFRSDNEQTKQIILEYEKSTAS